MNITTLADVYDTVYIIYDKSVLEATVTGIEISEYATFQSTKLEIKYRLKGFENFILQKHVFLTKQALLDSL